jgi:hydroxylaminobenzene mutase
MPLLVKLGICELAVAALSGWAMVAVVQRPEALRRVGFRHLGRIRQTHLDLLFMGVIVTVVGLAVQPLPVWVGVLLIAGAYMQPMMLLVLAVDAQMTENIVYAGFNGMLFLASSIAWVSLAIIVLSR